MTRDGPPTEWQCVLIAWGSKYPVAAINRLIEAIREQARHQPRIVLISDGPRPGLAADVIVRPIPQFYMDCGFTGIGCHTKLAMFEPGVVPDDLPAVYVDLDTVVTGDLGAIAGLLTDRRDVLMLPSAVLPFGPIGRLAYRMSKGRHYARGNSSVLVYHPAECVDIALQFRALFAQHPAWDFRPMQADERFISWAVQPRMRAIPRRLATKLSAEFMFPLSAWPPIRALLPWVRRRRAGQVAITLSGPEVKPEVLLALPEGAMVTDSKGRTLIWSDRAMGPLRQRIIALHAGRS